MLTRWARGVLPLPAFPVALAVWVTAHGPGGLTWVFALLVVSAAVVGAAQQTLP